MGATKTEIKEIIRMTIEELQRQGLYKPFDYTAVLSEMDPRMYKHFDDKQNEEIERALDELDDDAYIDVIYLQYRDRMTIEQIAESMGKDVSTIKRNKKRILCRIYDMTQK